jgi:D-alanyl-D-alanine carboxypeptidase (penicillin-binding protein 5/6)
MKIDESGRFLRLAATALTAAMFWLFCVSLIASRASEIKLAARAAVLMELRTGKILWQRNKDLSVAPASTTKILTALVVLERSKLDDIVTVPVEATLATGGTARLKEGERLAVEQLLYGMLLGSANDAAMALAKHAGGSVAKFVGMMNDKARSLGALQSSFRNPTGLGQRGHMTTARDLAVITKAALEKAEFRRLVNTKSHPWKSAQWQGTLKNSNVLLDSYPGAIGVKTGQTREAGFCIVAAAQRGATTLVAVILNSTDKAGWQDAENLLELGFKNFTAMSLIEPGDTVVTSMVDGRKVAIAAAEPAH